MTNEEHEKLIESLSPIERSVLPHVSEDLEKVIEQSSLDKTTVLRALEFLKNKNLINPTYL